MQTLINCQVENGWFEADTTFPFICSKVLLLYSSFRCTCLRPVSVLSQCCKDKRTSLSFYPHTQGPSEARFWSSRVAERWVNAASAINASFSLYPSASGTSIAQVAFGMDLGTALGAYFIE